jgi:hypothetical protein
MDKVIDEGEWISVLPGDGIQSSVVLDEAKLPIFLLDEEDWAPRGDLDCLMRPVASASSRKASIPVCSVRVIR